MTFSDISRNEEAARQELTQQAEALSLLRPLANLLNTRLKGNAKDIAKCDVIAATMWLFDNMLYHEIRSSCPGTTRQEAEALLVAHFSEAHPDWEKTLCIQLASHMFNILTPNEGFKPYYYNFTEHKHEECFFRLIEWETTQGSDVIYKLTPQGMLLYSTRLEEKGIEHATVSAIRANRTLRRGEIALAIDLAKQIMTDLRQFWLRIQAGLRAARMGDTSFTFQEKMKPLLDDSYGLLGEIFDQTISDLKHIQDARQNSSSEQRQNLLEAETVFRDVKIESRKFQNHISTVQQEFIEYRRDIIGQQDVLWLKGDLTEDVLKPLLAFPLDQITDYIEELVARMLPPALISKHKREALYCLNLRSLLQAYEDWLDEDETDNDIPLDDEREPYVELPPSLDEETISFANIWVQTYLAQHKKIDFDDIIAVQQSGGLTVKQGQACLLVVGALATSDKNTIKVLLDGKMSKSLWHGDNLGVTIINNSMIDIGG